MTRAFATIQTHCLAKEGAFEDYPWGETVWKVKPKGKVFCFGGETRMTVRATLDEQAALTELPGITPAHYLARHGWVSVDLTVPTNLDLAIDLIDRSYELVVGKKKRA
jgi:predicted DNA-binding protein (MmcQ/YjbR family)